jgi:ATP synthase protein I
MTRETPDMRTGDEVSPASSRTEATTQTASRGEASPHRVRTLYPQDDWDVEPDNNIVPLTRAEAEQLFGPAVSRPSRVTPYRVVAAQMVLSLVVTLAWWLGSAQPEPAALSALLGGALCWIPSALFAWRLQRGGGTSSVSLVIGEAVKMAVTLALFVAVALYDRGVHWLPLLVTYLVTLKTYWIALALN